MYKYKCEISNINVKTKGISTPGDRPGPEQENSHSLEFGPKDSGGGHQLLNSNINMETHSTRNGTQNPSQLNKSALKPSQFDFQREWQEEKLAREKLQQIVCQLQNHIKVLENKIKTIDKNNEATTSEHANDVEYFTDDEQLERDTDWILKVKENKRPSKKRKAESSPEQPTAQNKQERSTVKPAIEIQKKNAEKAHRKEYAPPPIMVHRIEVFNDLKQIVKEITNEDCKYTSYNNNVWKINVANSDIYRKITGKLTKKEIQWHSYEDKASRPIKVMARGLHPSCDENEICSDLINQGFKIREAKNILTKETVTEENGNCITKKRSLPLFMLTFNNQESPEMIYAIEAIMGIIVKIEPLRKTSNKIPQCKRCQAFGHTHRYCNKDFACVKYAGKHPTKHCTVARDQKAKCINCRGDHSANYRGCIIAKEQQKRKNQLAGTGRKKIKTFVPNSKPILRPKHQPTENRTNVNRKAEIKESYSTIVKKPAQVEKSSIEEMLALILKRLDEQDNAIKILSGKLSRANKSGNKNG